MGFHSFFERKMCTRVRYEKKSVKLSQTTVVTAAAVAPNKGIRKRLSAIFNNAETKYTRINCHSRETVIIAHIRTGVRKKTGKERIRILKSETDETNSVFCVNQGISGAKKYPATRKITEIPKRRREARFNSFKNGSVFFSL